MTSCPTDSFSGETSPRRRSLCGFRAVVLQEARQVGKSTLAELLADTGTRRWSRSIARRIWRQHATTPGLFLDAPGTPAVIDEVQRCGDQLVLAIEQRLDARRVSHHVSCLAISAMTNDSTNGPTAGSLIRLRSAKLHHIRDRDGLEVDAVIEASDGRVVVSK